MAKKTPNQPKLDFEKLIHAGEHPAGFTSQTVNGTAHYKGGGWNKQWNWDEGAPQVEQKGAWNGNRTGE